MQMSEACSVWLQPGYQLDPFVTYSQQSAPGGVWNFPPAGETPFVLLKGAVVYLNITASDCQLVSHPKIANSKKCSRMEKLNPSSPGGAAHV